MANLLILHGPNLNLLGAREPHLYGHSTLDNLNQKLIHQAQELGHVLRCVQSNSEAQLIDLVQRAPMDEIDFMIINPAAYTHTSIALRDAVAAIHIPFIEVHITNIYAREPFRHQSFFSDIAIGTLSGLGTRGYEFALTYANQYLSEHTH
ncbi:MAG: type II 3-dehydroquinate dehydratase [Gammaproteobacteria bacterium]|nr:type II 3-dehydroquinate dehydratase [Gammaproteobacteria bacterium]